MPLAHLPRSTRLEGAAPFRPIAAMQASHTGSGTRTGPRGVGSREGSGVTFGGVAEDEVAEDEVGEDGDGADEDDANGAARVTRESAASAASGADTADGADTAEGAGVARASRAFSLPTEPPRPPVLLFSTLLFSCTVTSA